MLDNTAFLGVVGTAITAIVTYLVASANNRKEEGLKRAEYVDNQLKELVKLYKDEVNGLKEEMKELIEENKLLREEIIDLKQKLIEIEGGEIIHGQVKTIIGG